MRLLGWTAAILAVCTAASVATAGSIAPRLQAEMDRQGPGAIFSVIVNMKDQAPVPALNAELSAAKATRQERHARVVAALQLAARGQQPLIASIDQQMRSGGILGYTSYWISNMMVVQATKEAIAEIARRPDVDLIEPNFTAELMTPVTMEIPRMDQQSGAGDGTRGIGVTPGLRAIRAPEVWHQLGFTGAGRLIGGLDTGVDGNHPALRTRWRGYQGQQPWQECWLDLIGTNTQSPTDTYGHGTHTMGTMCGLGAATNDTVGVSWEAKWIACNAINQGVGGAFDNDVITAFQWFADPDGNPNTVDDVPDVVQNSWRINEGFGNGYTDCDSRWWNAIDGCEAAGVVVTYSAGNEGPGAQTIGSPPDRATTLYNAFAIGAVDATSYSWPYPIASFSSRGPTGCNVPADRKIKPEVVAPGVNVYSSIPGGGYDGNWSGTSMAGPHVAGIVGLMRQANPNLAVDDIKRILMETARDEGTTGEENTYGWGFVDAYNAVIQATVGFGQIDGHVTSAWNGSPVQGATVQLLEIGNQYTTDALGYYSGSAPVATYTVEARHPDFRPDTVQVTLVANQLVSQNFALVDDRGPSITAVTNNITQPLNFPTPIRATVTDPSTVTGVMFHYRINGNGWIDQPMSPLFGGIYTVTLSAFSVGTRVDYYISASDAPGNASQSPAGAPASFYSLFFTETLFADDAEQDNNWSLQASGDNATTGRWVRDNPVGTTYDGHPCQPEDDHTFGPGVTCFVTENGTPGGDANAKDVDNGCTTLTAPSFNLNGRARAFLTYYRWWAQEITLDDQFQIDGSSDGGSSWVPLERVGPAADESWRKVTVDLSQYLNFTGNMKVRFKACDQMTGGIVEAGIDDYSIETFNPTTSDAADASALPTRPLLEQNEPNPFNPVTTIKFALSNPAPTRIEIFDATGRLVRVLADAPMTAGVHTVVWNGLDDAGRPSGSGVYFYRLKAGAFEQSRRMTILK